MSIILHEDFNLKTAFLSYAEMGKLLGFWAGIPGTAVDCLVFTV